MRIRILAVVLALTGLPALPARASHVPAEIRLDAGSLQAVVRTDPFRISFEQDGRTVLSDATADPTDGRGPLAFTVDARAQAQVPAASYGVFLQAPTRWFHATRVVRVEDGRLVVATDDPLGRTWSLRVTADGEGVARVTATLDEPAAVSASGWMFRRPDDERFLGFGERSEGADQTGRTVETWTEEGPFSAGAMQPTTSQVFGDRWQGPPPVSGTNFPIPWFVSSRGYGLLADHSSPVTFELGRPAAWSLTTREPSVRFRVFAGPRPADVLARFTSAVGRQPRPAPWFFGPWFQPTGPNAQDLASIWRERDVPVTVAQTYTHYLPCAAQSSTAPEDRRRFTDAYHGLGYKVTTYVNPFVCSDHPGGAYGRGDANGWFVRTQAGTTYPVPYVAYYRSPWHGVVDFTNPDAARFWQELVGEALDDGYDGWMEDFGEYVPPDARMHDGRSGLEAHNDYCTLYHRASDELTRPRRGDDFAQFVRCGYTGTARWARIVWGGDPTEDWSKADGLAAAVSQATSMGLSGVAFWGSDIGGFHALFTSGRTDAELTVRWLEFGAFSGVMRTQANGFGRPGQGSRSQVWDPAVAPVWRKFAKLRTQLYPYIARSSQEYLATGMPLMRHLSLLAPDHPAVYAPDAEYEFGFGPDMLVAPVVQPGATSRTLYLPPGRWIDFWDATTYDEASGSFDARPGAAAVEGGRTITVDAPLDRIPLYVREGACVPMLPADVDTLAEVGDAPGLVHLSDAEGRSRTLGFGADCA